MSEKFVADPERLTQGLASLEALANFIVGVQEAFDASLENAGEILGSDKFGRAAYETLSGQHELLTSALEALTEVVRSVPDSLHEAGRYTRAAQAKVLDSINAAGVGTEDVPKAGSAGRR